MNCLDPVKEALERVADPCSIATGAPINLVDMGLVKDVRLEGEEAVVELRLTNPFCLQVGTIVEKVREATAGVDSVTRVRVEVDPISEWNPEMMASEARRRLRKIRPIGDAV